MKPLSILDVIRVGIRLLEANNQATQRLNVCACGHRHYEHEFNFCVDSGFCKRCACGNFSEMRN